MKTPPADWSSASQELSQWLARSALGDRVAFAKVYERTSGALFAQLLRIQRDRALAEELLQEVYVAVWKAAGSFDAARAQPMTWLVSIARNRAIDSLRRAGREPATESLSHDDDEAGGTSPDADIADETGDPLNLLSQASDARELGRCMQGLSAPQRQSVALAFYDGLTHSEVAERLHQPLGTVKSWVRRALQALKSCLDAAAARDRNVSA
jgi:RNA polymerase sigma-70 factor (ECF subfamily)